MASVIGHFDHGNHALPVVEERYEGHGLRKFQGGIEMDVASSFRKAGWVRGIMLLACLYGCFYGALYGSGVANAAPVWSLLTIELKQVFGPVSLTRPLTLIEAPVSSTSATTSISESEAVKPRVWYVVEQAGRVLRIQQLGSTLNSSVFVDLRRSVESGPNEAGLLGMALDPGFAKNGLVYLSYTREVSGSSENSAALVSVLSRMQSADGGQTLAAQSEQILLEVEQPYSNHNGGDIHFGPDGYLYYGLGDGGSAGDPQGNGQNTQTLLGSLLRLDVREQDAEKQTYQIPKDNPFVTAGGRAEIFAYGLRNPWRWSFDRNTGDLWLADVGQNTWEEVNIIKPGGNYGWSLREGGHCYSGECQREGLIEPVAEYSHDDGCSVTGGYVYRGKKLRALQGVYLFGDFCTGKIWGLFSKADGTYHRQLLFKSGLNIASFAEDQAGEIYVLDLGGKVFQLTANN